MSVFYSAQLKEENNEVFYKPTDRCFYCGETLGGDHWIVWQGLDDHAAQIWMHPSCASRFADHLKSDFAKFTKQNPEQIL